METFVLVWGFWCESVVRARLCSCRTSLGEAVEMQHFRLPPQTLWDPRCQHCWGLAGCYHLLWG